MEEIKWKELENVLSVVLKSWFQTFRLHKNGNVKNVEMRCSKMAESIKVFEVPNNAMGRMFIRLMREFLNRKQYSVRVRGRHSNRAKLIRKLGHGLNFCGDVPVKHAERLAVYLDNQAMREAMGKRWEAEAQYRDLQQKLREIKTKVLEVL